MPLTLSRLLSPLDLFQQKDLGLSPISQSNTPNEHQKAILLHAPFKGLNLFGEALAEVNMEWVKTLTVFPHPAAPSPPIPANPTLGCGQTYRKGFSHWWEGGDSKQDKPAPSATITKACKDSHIFTVTVPQDSTKCHLEKSSDSHCQSVGY